MRYEEINDLCNRTEITISRLDGLAALTLHRMDLL
jgi:hypothetical protein